MVSESCLYKTGSWLSRVEAGKGIGANVMDDGGEEQLIWGERRESTDRCEKKTHS